MKEDKISLELKRIADALEFIAYGDDAPQRLNIHDRLHDMNVDLENISGSLGEFNSDFFRQPIEVKTS